MVPQFVREGDCIDWLAVRVHEKWGIWVECETGLLANVAVVRKGGNWAYGAVIFCKEQVHTISQSVTLRMFQVQGQPPRAESSAPPS